MRIDDERLQWVSVTEVVTDKSLDRATVFFTAALGDEASEKGLVEVFEEHRSQLQRAIGQQARLRRTPPLRFEPDLHLRQAERIDSILRSNSVNAPDEIPQGDEEE